MKFEANGITYVVRDELIPRVLTELLTVYGKVSRTSVTEHALSSHQHRKTMLFSDSVFRQDIQKFLKHRTFGTQIANDQLKMSKQFIEAFT